MSAFSEFSEFSEFQCISPAGDRCGEALVWSEPERALYWADINRFLIHRHDLDTQATRSWFFAEPVVALALSDEPGRLLVALASRLLWWWPHSDRRQDQGVSLPGYPGVRFNDGRADPRGDFWVGSMKNNVRPDGELGEVGPGLGELWQVRTRSRASAEGTGVVTVWRQGLGISNTLCWSPDRTRFYFADTLANCLWVYDYDPGSGRIANPREFFAGFERGVPDGSAIDADGHLWNCRYGGGCIVRLTPQGRIDRIVETPVANPTTCAFGGRDGRTLYFTSAANQAPPGDRLAGSVFAWRAPVAGLAENRVHVQA